MNKSSQVNAGDASDEKALIKPFLGSNELWHLNACVGGNTGSYDNTGGYVDGFKSAAEVLLRSLGVAKPPKADENWGSGSLIDTLVYPICYCARHHVELALKHAIGKAWTILNMRPRKEPHRLSTPRKNEITHSLFSVWEPLNNICTATADQRLIQPITSIRPYVVALDDVDQSGQTFRYATSAEDSSPHLAEISRINLQHFAEWYAELSELLEELALTLDFLEFEYSAGSFTKELTRPQLVEIAETLPSRDKWGTDAFKIAKEQILVEYKIGSNDFTRACDLIQTTRALSHLVGVVIPITELKEDTFIRLYRASRGSKAALDSFGQDECSAIFGLLRIGAPGTYPESFESVLNAPRPNTADAADQFDLDRDPEYLARKASSSPDVIERALRSLGQVELLAQFREVFADDILQLKKLREQSRDLNFAEILSSIRRSRDSQSQDDYQLS